MSGNAGARGLAIGWFVLAAGALSVGCGGLRHANSSAFVARDVRASDDPAWVVAFKCSVLYPARDILTLDPLWRRVFGDEAWNAAGEGVADGSFYTNRRPEELTPAAVARGACTMPPPQPPFRIERLKRGGGTRGFVGRDAAGRRFLFKLDDPDYPELGTTAEIVGSRILWALGYNVPAVFLVRIEGTGDARFDGRRATAALFLDGARGGFRFDWFRYRREVRALRLACAWLNDTDRVGTNTLVVVTDGRPQYYLIDFNSCLGSWQGRPKEPWRGHRHQWDLGWTLLELLSLGRLRAEPNPAPPVVSPAVGRFDGELEPLAWRSQLPNTAFDHLSEADMRWMAARIRAVGREQLAAAVGAAGLSARADARYLVATLLQRRARILRLTSR